jgi:hypothetical protein
MNNNLCLEGKISWIDDTDNSGYTRPLRGERRITHGSTISGFRVLLIFTPEDNFHG